MIYISKTATLRWNVCII